MCELLIWFSSRSDLQPLFFFSTSARFGTAASSLTLLPLLTAHNLDCGIWAHRVAMADPMELGKRTSELSWRFFSCWQRRQQEEECCQQPEAAGVVRTAAQGLSHHRNVQPGLSGLETVVAFSQFTGIYRLIGLKIGLPMGVSFGRISLLHNLWHPSLVVIVGPEGRGCGNWNWRQLCCG
jgi:hypothetical protein